MFKVRDINGNEYTVYHVQMVTKKKLSSDGEELAEKENEMIFVLYNPYAKEWQWSETEGLEPVG